MQQDVAEATALGDDVMKKIVGTSLDTPSEITALAAMDEQERAQIIERAVAGETVSAVKPERMSEPKAAPRNRRIGSHRDVRRGFPTSGALHIVGS